MPSSFVDSLMVTTSVGLMHVGDLFECIHSFFIIYTCNVTHCDPWSAKVPYLSSPSRELANLMSLLNSTIAELALCAN